MIQPLWRPTPAQVERARLTSFLHQLRASGGGASTASVRDLASLWRWSIEEPEAFWSAVWTFCEVIADARADGTQWETVLHGRHRMQPPDRVQGPNWFRGARLNFAENLLRRGDEAEALVSWTEEGRQGSLSFAELRAEVARVAEWLREVGVVPGDRVAGYLPNIPETVVAMLATTTLGAVWSSCSPDFGVAGVVDRFGQIAPKVLFAADHYRYAGKFIDLRARLIDITHRLTSVEHLALVQRGTGSLDARVPVHHWNALGSKRGTFEPEYARLPFDHPLCIMYSSGTTGLPKCMVHGAGGTLLQHLKELVLHTDLRPDARIFYFTTCGWMMWNWLVSSLAVGSTVVLYDGAPMPAARPEILWDLAQAERLTVFGTSAKYIALAEKAAFAPERTHDLSALEAILSTGSPLSPQSFDYVYRDVKPDVRLSSISGGTDIISCFALGDPTGPVHRGELQTRGLGMAVDVFDEDGQPLRGRPGELVCTAPFPSMPTHFWNDPDGSKYREAYFARWPNVWRHGDWSELTPHDGMIIHGRSDATLNPGGVRIGTAEIYRQVEQLEEIVESIVVGHEVDDDVRIVLFVRLREGLVLDERLRDRIRRTIRETTSPHHVPRVIVQVPDIPRTISGKITELAVRNVISGRPVDNIDALANPESLDFYRGLDALK